MKISELIPKLELVRNTDGDYETDDITTQEGLILLIGYGWH